MYIVPVLATTTAIGMSRLTPLVVLSDREKPITVSI